MDYDDKGNPIDVELSTARSREEEKRMISLPTEWRFYHLGEGKIDEGVFKPLFPEGTKFTFRILGTLEITDAPAYYITIYFPVALKKLQKEELEKPSIAEIVKEETRVRK